MEHASASIYVVVGAWHLHGRIVDSTIVCVIQCSRSVQLQSQEECTWKANQEHNEDGKELGQVSYQNDEESMDIGATPPGAGEK